jgi:hypothetical protein
MVREIAPNVEGDHIELCGLRSVSDPKPGLYGSRARHLRGIINEPVLRRDQHNVDELTRQPQIASRGSLTP